MSKASPVPREVDEFIAKTTRCFMVTLRKDGSPTAHPMGGFSGGGLFLNMYRESVKAKILFRDPRICCLVTTASDAPDFQAIAYRGQARFVPIEEDATGRQGLERARNPYATSEERTRAARSATPDDPEEARRRLSAVNERVKAGIRIVFEVVPEDAAFLQKVRGE